MMPLRSLIFLLLFLPCLASFASPPLVDAEWLQANRERAGLVILDLQADQAYQRYHIPGAVHTNFADWRRKTPAGVPQIIPPVADLERLIGNLGITNTSHVILVVTGSSAGEMASATRVYWTFKALGHDAVSILDGGLIAYAQTRKYPLQKGSNKPRPNSFKASLRTEYLPDAQQVKAAISEDVLPVDNRSQAEYLGIYTGGEKERAGSLPGAVHLNYDWLTVNGGGRFQSLENLKTIYRASKVPLSGPQLNYCHTGLRASLGWFVSHELLGNQQARLYDGSTAEWAVDPSLPMEASVKLCSRDC